ncbi:MULTISPECIES: hypothetical protein [unclassified Pseudomonas]|uniref:hypothetical protein n=1 Tax=unclassified Pseudomonas TaxID=196821 RepID=UPI00244AAD71|nr:MULTISPECIES: hypothetical protein [unclassified Pseudomonas]MDG9927436.1 hypothetical protein [Pseudomonas sp. GD04042]MDH0482505.1 hypothetical protein [Pseudomonas sp. GD04015]MDH0602857.1 hypothetical protein [Pseudomonas sp. GD03869]
MLTPDQQDELLLSLFATAEAMQQQLTPAAAQLMVQDLKGYDEQPLAAALQAVRREGGRFTVAAVLKHLEAADGRPEPNEAWAIALQSFDEAETVLLTDEIRQATAAASSVFHAGDKIGARMAFLAAYQRLVDSARRDARAVVWHLSLGHNPERRALAVEEAQRLGRLPAPEAQRLLADLRPEQITADGQAIAGLLTGRAGTPSPETRQRLAAIRDQLTASGRQRDAERQAQVAAQRQDLAERVDRHMAALNQLQESQA